MMYLQAEIPNIKYGWYILSLKSKRTGTDDVFRD